MLARASNPEPPLREIGMLGVGEMKQNIDEGGRPEKWKPSIRVQRSGGQTLRLSGALYNSISFGVGSGTVVWGPGGTASKYAAIQNFGGTIKAKNKPMLKFFIPGVGWIAKKEVTIPARPFDTVSPETQMTFGEILRAFIVQ